jgi:hypothetical protein
MKETHDEYMCDHCSNTGDLWVLFGWIFVFSNLHRLDSHSETCVALTNLQLPLQAYESSTRNFLCTHVDARY